MYADNDYSHDPHAQMDPRTSYSDDSDGLDRPAIPVHTPTPPSARTPPSDDHAHMMTHDRSPRSHHRERSRYSTNREFMKLLVGEELEAKQTRKFLRSALARLDNETLRAQEAERRALELADRFKIVNDARIVAQTELTRVNEELRLYKVQYDNAQREITRGQDILKSLEQQRDEAEASAARARTTARRLKEEQLMMRAREEGRQAGYAEGLRKGVEEARRQFERVRTNTEDGDSAPANDGTGSLPDADVGSRAGPLDELPVRGLGSPAPSITVQSPVPRRNIPDFDIPSGPPQGSRFREHGIGVSPASTNVPLSNGPPQWQDQQMRPRSIVNDMPSPRRAQANIPDNWIPQADKNGRINIPPSHALQPPLSPNSSDAPLPVPPPFPERNVRHGEPSARDYAYSKPQTPSLADSVPTSVSTKMSDFDILNPPPQQAHRNPGGDRKSGLSVIHEVSSSAEYSPATTSMPEPLVFPGVPPNRGPEDPGSGMRTPRSRTPSQRGQPDELKYNDPRAVEEWRRRSGELRSNPSRNSLGTSRTAPVTMPSPLGPHHAAAADYLRPNSAAGSRTPQPHRSPSVVSHHSNNSSKYPPSSSGQDIAIYIEPPSGPPSSGFSPVNEMRGLLSPNTSQQNLPPPQPAPVIPSVPTVPNSPSTMGRYPSLGAIQRGPTPVDTLPPGFMPTPQGSNRPLNPPQSSPRSASPNIYGGYSAPTDMQRSASTSSPGPRGKYPQGMHGRSFSAGNASNDSLRSKTPVARPPSSASSGAGIYAAAPIPSGIRYPAPPGRPPTSGSGADRGGLMSPRSTTSQLSGHYRSLSSNAGSTPAPPSRPLSTAPTHKLRRVPSDTSNESGVSGLSANAKQQYNHYDAHKYVDPAFLASSEDLTANVTSANTVANANAGRW